MLPYGFPNDVLLGVWQRAYIAGCLDQANAIAQFVTGADMIYQPWSPRAAR